MTATQLRPRRETVRAGILTAAETAFLEHGYDRTTVSDIATAAGFTKGAVYSNFGGKPELLRAVCAAHIDAIADSVTARFARNDTHPIPAGDAARRVARALTVEITGSSSWPALWTEFRTLAGHDPAVRTAYVELRIQLCDGVQQRLQAHAGDLALPADADLAVAATLLLTVAHGLAVEHATAPEAVPARLIEDSLTRLIGGLR